MHRSMLLALITLGLSAAAMLGSSPAQTPPPAQAAEATAPHTPKKVKVFILMGQSNMVGMGDIGPAEKPGTLLHLTKTDGKYAELVDGHGDWTARADVFYYDARTKKGAPLGALANNGKSIGPELGFGFAVGDAIDAPVLVLKSCIGNRSLGWDLLPPGSERFEFEGKTYAGYKDTPDWWIEGQPKKQVDWYAGKQYDTDLANAMAALEHLDAIMPGYKSQGYEIAGFVWWQGHKDQNAAHAGRYERNLVNLIASLRKDYQAPDAKFVLATIGFNGWKLDGAGKTVAEAQLAVADATKHPELAGSVRCVESRGFWRDAAVSPKDQGYHYNRNAETYMEVGLALGRAMNELLAAKP